MSPLQNQVQKALVLPALQSPYVVAHTQRIPAPSAGEVRIKVLSVGLNALDWKLPRGLFDSWLDGRLPAVVAGMGIAGEVDELGENVTGFQKGDRV